MQKYTAIKITDVVRKMACGQATGNKE